MSIKPPNRRLTESDWAVIQAAREYLAARDNACSMRLDPVADAVEALVLATELWEHDEQARQDDEADERRRETTGDTRV